MDWKYGYFKHLILFICFTNQFNGSFGASASKEFIIKNRYCGKYIHGWSSTSKYLGSSSYLRLYENIPNLSSYVFEPVEGIWGLIRHSESNAIWHPYGGSSNTRKEATNIQISSYHPERWALWAIDQVNSRIIHRDGQYVEYDNGYDPYPPNNDYIELSHSIHDGMNWAFLNPKNHSETVYPYGAPKISAEWEMVYAVESPLATQTWEYTYTLGKSLSRSTSSSVDYHEGFEFTWESSSSASRGFSFWGSSSEYSSSYSQSSSRSSSISWQVSTASEDTWYGEVQETSSVVVPAGKTVVVWQKVFIGSQLGHKAVFQSNHFAYTNSTAIRPEY